MKLTEIFKLFAYTPSKKKSMKEYSLSMNDIEILDLKVYSTMLHTHTIKYLREFKSQQPGVAWVLRNKKGFNTMFFQVNYDIVVCDKFGNVIDLFIDCKNGYVSNFYKEGYFVYFFSLGSIKFYEIKKSSRLTLALKNDSIKIAFDILGI